MPTENGTVLHAGRRPRQDATLVSLLRAAGAIILGKTVTTELAVYAPNKTRNPHNPEHTPGARPRARRPPWPTAWCRSRSAPRPTARSSAGIVLRRLRLQAEPWPDPRTGVLTQSPPLDTIGVMAAELEGLAFLAEPLMAFDAKDPPAARPAAARGAARGAAGRQARLCALGGLGSGRGGHQGRFRRTGRGAGRARGGGRAVLDVRRCDRAAWGDHAGRSRQELRARVRDGKRSAERAAARDDRVRAAGARRGLQPGLERAATLNAALDQLFTATMRS